MFGNINFRYTDAQEEKNYSPEIIEKTFVDIENILSRVDLPEKFIVTGSKGSGKSALSSKLQLISKNSWNLFVANDDLEQFDFKLLAKSTSEKTTGLNSTVNIWQLLLLIRLIPLFLSDQGLIDKNIQLRRLDNGLKKIGLVASSSLISIVEYTSSRGIFSKLKSLAGEVGFSFNEGEKYSIKQPSAVVDTIKEVLKTISGTDGKKYYLILDGLDYTIRYGKGNTNYLADLISASRVINNFFSCLNINAKIIILIREEIVFFIPDPNLAKRLNDNGIQIKWYDNQRGPFKTRLLEIIEKSAHLAGFTETIDVLWSQWFGSDADKWLRFILNNTRHLPRDLISFFRELQKINAYPPFSREDILAALANYSDWFFSELNDSIVGIIDETIRNNITLILSSLGKRFLLSDFDIVKQNICPTVQIPSESILQELFNTSWIGNIWEENGKIRFAWKHRKKNAVFNPHQEICLHKGLYKTLNLI